MTERTPTRKYHVELCNCYEGDYRGEVVTFYERQDNRIKCANCGTIPPEIRATPIPDSHRVELMITHYVDDRITRLYREVLHPANE